MIGIEMCNLKETLPKVKRRLRFFDSRLELLLFEKPHFKEAILYNIKKIKQYERFIKRYEK